MIFVLEFSKILVECIKKFTEKVSEKKEYLEQCLNFKERVNIDDEKRIKMIKHAAYTFNAYLKISIKKCSDRSL